MNTLADSVTAIRPFIPDLILSERYFDKIKDVSFPFPAMVTRFFGFECELHHNRNSSDFAFSITREAAGNHLNRMSFPNGKDWERLSNFITPWQDKSSAFHDVIDSIFLEYDLAGEAQKQPIPSLFVSFNNHLNSKSSSDKKNKEYLKVTEETLTLLKGASFFSKINPLHLKILELLPPKAGVFQLGLMLSRPLEAIRLCLTGLNIDETIRLLSHISWPGSIQNVRRILETVLPMSHQFYLAMDVGMTPFPKVGFEISFDERTIDKRNPKWLGFLGYLTENGLCTEQKAQGLLDYPGYVYDNPYVFLFTDAWPEDFYSYSAGRKKIFLKKINHFKIVYEEGKPVRVKAYLAVHQGWMHTT